MLETPIWKSGGRRRDHPEAFGTAGWQDFSNSRTWREVSQFDLDRFQLYSMKQ